MMRTTQSDQIGRAIAWLLLGVAGGLGLDLCAKELLQTYPLQEFVWMRSFIGLSIFLMLAPRLFGGYRRLQTSRWKWHLLRTVLATGAMFGFFFGLSKMPLVNALILGYTAPLMMTALSVPFLNEAVGWRRWAAVFAGFIGTVVMLRPGSENFSLASITILVAAFCYACQAISARHLTSESTLSLSVYVVTGPLLIASIPMGNEAWLTPDSKGWVLFACAGACSVIAWVGFINGYRGASPVILAPFEYSALIGGAIAGYLIWGEVPDRHVLFGATIIVASSLYVVYREIVMQHTLAEP